MKKILDRVGSAVSMMLSRITLKIWLSTAAVGLAVILLIFILSDLFLESHFLNNAIAYRISSNTSAAEGMDESLDNIIMRMINICTGTSDFRMLLMRIRADQYGLDRQMNNDLQEHLADLSSCNPLVRSAIITTQSGAVYYPVFLNLGYTPDFTLGYDESAIRRITLLPLQKSPSIADGWVLPLAVPFTFYAGNSLLYFADDASSADAILYLFLDVDDINDTLALYQDTGVTYLMNGEGTILNYLPGSENGQLAQSCDLPRTVAVWSEEDGKTVRLGDWYALREPINQRDLYLVHLVQYSDLIAPLTDIGNTLLMLALSAIVIITLATLFIAIYLAKPLRQINHAVRAIGGGTYSSDMALPQRDEIGELSRSVDRMYHIIQAQMTQIRDERQAKYNAEMRLFAEQINPHFLYNTLEYINLEVYNHHNENASMMIQALGDFLRIGLNFGGELLPLSREVAHVQAYVAIMNHRFHQDICFATDIPDELLQQPVAKVILQPLVENSIRHGFQLGDNTAFIEIPTITVRGRRTEDAMLLSVVDNGIGFDVEHARRIMHEDPALQKHVGLSNVYHRLKLHYGEGADILLQSISYYKNTVTIRIPLCDAAERSTE
ncbi:MAG: histidine kinase [Clostridia bacterium]|nr:histidine kinase [Clostridia bacterium]